MLVGTNHHSTELIPHVVHDAKRSTTRQSVCQEIDYKVAKGCVISFLGINGAPEEPVQTIVARLKSASVAFICKRRIKE